jgi:hypothetical protein
VQIVVRFVEGLEGDDGVLLLVIEVGWQREKVIDVVFDLWVEGFEKIGMVLPVVTGVGGMGVGKVGGMIVVERIVGGMGVIGVRVFVLV